MNNGIRLMLAGALAFTAAASAASPVLAQRSVQLEQGERPRENRRTRDAEKHLDMADAGVMGPEVADSLYEEALANANEAIEDRDNNPLGYLLAGRALLGLGRFEEAVAALDKAEELRPVYMFEIDPIREGGWFDQYEVAQPLLSSGDYPQAAVVLENANLLYKKRPEVMIVLGQIYASAAGTMTDPAARMETTDKAIERLREADEVITTLTQMPEVDSALAASWLAQQAEIPVTIAQALISAERYDEAAAALQGLVESNPGNILYATNLAGIYAQSEKPDSAKLVYSRLLTRTDLAPKDLYMIGIGLYQANEYGLAAGAFKGGVEIASKDRDAVEMWTRSLQLSLTTGGGDETPEQTQEVVTAAEQWTALDPNNRVGLLILAQAVNKAGDEPRTIELVEQIEALNVGLIDLQLERQFSGGASLRGDIENLKADPGTLVTIEFTFYDLAGNTLGTSMVQVSTGLKDARTPFQTVFDSEQQVDGYTYTLSM
jgi:tetratricopeptide (TPR) repeat protein